MEKKIQGISDSYDEVIEELTSYIESRLDFWNNYVVNEDEHIELIDVQLHGSRLRGQARDDSDLDCVFEYSGPAREDALFNFMNYDDEEETYTIWGIPVDFNPIKADDSGNMTDYMTKSDKYDQELLDAVRNELEEAVEMLTNNGYIVEGILGKTLATGALAAGMAMANSNIKSHSVVDPALDFGKNTEVHIQDRHNFDQTKYGVPTSFKLKDGSKVETMNHRDEINLTKQKILATPDSLLNKGYIKEHIDEIANYMVRTANKYNIDIDILLAIAGTESNFNNNTNDSGKGARGMMQITDVAAYDSHIRLQKKDSTTYNFNNIRKLETNIDEAGRIIADWSVRRNNVVEMIFASYNGGNAQATAWRHSQNGKELTKDGNKAPKLSKETKNYVRQCMELYKTYKTVQDGFNAQKTAKTKK